MNRKKGIICLCIIVFVMMVAGYFLSHNYTPYLSPQLKAKIQEAHITNMGGEEYYKRFPDGGLDIVWFDENGGKRDYRVVRHFGTYGDCIVLIEYDDARSATGRPIDPPYVVDGLTRRVESPSDFKIMLYNMNPDYMNPDCTDWEYLLAPYTSLTDVQQHKGEWLTDEQLEQLTCDFEAWLAAGNY